MSFLILIILAVVAYVVVKLFGGYNALQSSAQKIKEAKSNILVMLKKRKLLVERLADVVKAYASHEKDILLGVATSQANEAETAGKSYRDTSALLLQMQTLAQRFPAIKADAQYMRHMNDITAIETELQQKREHYNSLVTTYNASKRSIPMVFFAKKLGFEDAPHLDFDDHESLDQIKDFTTDEGEGISRMVESGVSSLQKAANSAGTRAAELAVVAKEKVAVAAETAKEKAVQVAEVAKEKASRLRKTKYHYAIKGVVHDPVSLDRLESMLAAGELTDRTNVLAVGTNAWVKLGEVLASTREVIPPPPPEED